MIGIRSWSHLVKEDHLSALGDMKLLLNISKNLVSSNYFLFSHLILTHHPFYLNEKCRFMADYTLKDNLLYYKPSQNACATSLLAQTLNNLQTKKFFNRSLVIIISDHGISGSRERVFFAVKPPGQDVAPLQFSSRNQTNTDLFRLVITAIESKELKGDEFLRSGLLKYGSEAEVVEVLRTDSLNEVWRSRRKKILFKDKGWIEEIRSMGFIVSENGQLKFGH